MAKKSEKIEKTTTIRGLEEEFVPHSPSWGIAKDIFTSETGVNIETLYEVVQHVPEVLGCINAVIEDIMADGWRFEGSKSAIKNAKKFQLKSKFYKILTNAIFDLIITGNAYILKLQVDEDKLKEVVVTLRKNLLKNFAINPEDLNIKENAVFELIDQDFKIPNDLLKIVSYYKDSELDATAKSYQLEQNTCINHKHLDRAISLSNNFGTRDDRFNLIFRSNTSHSIRNSYQLVACLTVFFVSCQLLRTDPQT